MLAAFAAISGSMVGSFASVVGTWITQKQQDLRDLRARKIAGREALYSDFIVESTRLLVDALEHNVSDPQKLIPVYAFLFAGSGNGRGSHEKNSRDLFRTQRDC